MIRPKLVPSWICASLFLAGAVFLLRDSAPPVTVSGARSGKECLDTQSKGLNTESHPGADRPKVDSQIRLIAAEEPIDAKSWNSQTASDVPIVAAQGSETDANEPDARQPGDKQADAKGRGDNKPARDRLWPSQPVPPGVQLPPQGTVASLSQQDRAILASLPPICTSDLPGLNLDEQNRGITLAMMEGDGQAAKSQQTAPARTVPAPKAQPPATKSARSPSAPVAQVPETAEQHLINAVFGLAEQTAQAQSNQAQVYPINQLAEDPTTRLASLNPHSQSASESAPRKDPTGPDPHLELYSRSPFPSATECAQCHQQIYDEWAVSGHAYASISPMFHAFEDTVNRLAQGTIGYFCLRCHAPVATAMGLRRDQPIWDGPRVFREGVTCVACHRVKSIYTKANGERRIEPGDVYDPVYGSGSGESVEIANKYAQFFKFKTDPSDQSPGQPIHRQAIEYEELKESSYCMACHHVQVKPGIKLEVVWDQYRASPAYRDGVTCQDCHMGKVPGVAAGYSVGPAAVFEEKTVNPERRHSNHVFYGPGYSIAHPGIFPDDSKADRWKVNQWLEFDWRAGWGTEAFEQALAEGKITTHFPPDWQDADSRYDAREIVDRNLKKLEYKKDLRRQVLENGSKLDGPFFTTDPKLNQNLNFYYCLTSLNSGHNMPSGSLGAQPQIWMNVVLIDPAGNRIWETGYLDSQGDLADRHSADVLSRKIVYDSQLMNLQTRFLTTNVKGTEREMYLPFNLDIDQLPFLRPAPQPVSVLNHPPLIRMEAHSLPPLGSRNVKYSIPRHLIQQPGTYRLSVRLRSRAEPIYFMKFCGATSDMIRSMNEWIADFHVQSVIFEVR